jgi:hypothetical protein
MFGQKLRNPWRSAPLPWNPRTPLPETTWRKLNPDAPEPPSLEQKLVIALERETIRLQGEGHYIVTGHSDTIAFVRAMMPVIENHYGHPAD